MVIMINNDDINKKNMAEFAQEPLSTLPADIDSVQTFFGSSVTTNEFRGVA